MDIVEEQPQQSLRRGICDGFRGMVGNTPLTRFSRIFGSLPFHFFGKMEMFNPGGSIKDRTAISILEHALQMGLVHKGTTIIESSSGNMGIALAQLCRYHGLKLILVVDPCINRMVVDLLNVYGAHLVFVDQPDGNGGFLNSRLDKVRELLAQVSGSFWPNQYGNPAAPLAHRQTWAEIVASLGCPPDYLFVPTSTCGTLMGLADQIQQVGALTKLIAVDATGSLVFSDRPEKRRIPGMGSSRKSDFLDRSAVQGIIHVSDCDAVKGCRRFLDLESMLIGGSSGAVIHAIGCMANHIPELATVVGILPDRGERYLDTIFSDDWVAAEGLSI